MVSWKKEVIDDLKNYELRKASLRNLAERIETAECDIQSIRANQISERVVGSPDNSGDALLSKMMELDGLKKQLKDTQENVDRTDRCLTLLTEKQRMILEQFYIHRTFDCVEDLMEKLHVERTRVYDMKNEALRCFTEAMYGIQPKN